MSHLLQLWELWKIPAMTLSAKNPEKMSQLLPSPKRLSLRLATNPEERKDRLVMSGNNTFPAPYLFSLPCLLTWKSMWSPGLIEKTWDSKKELTSSLEEVIKRSWPPIDLWVGPGNERFLLPPPSLECTLHPPFHNWNHFEGLARAMCCWAPLDGIAVWSPLRSLHKLLRFWLAGVETYLSCSCPGQGS